MGSRDKVQTQLVINRPDRFLNENPKDGKSSENWSDGLENKPQIKKYPIRDRLEEIKVGS